MISFKRAMDAFGDTSSKLGAWSDGCKDLMKALESAADRLAGKEATFFQQSIAAKRAALGSLSDSAEIQESIGTTVEELLSFADQLSSAGNQKEAEYKRIIRIVADAGLAMKQIGSHQAEEIVGFATKLDSVSRLDSIVEIRQEMARRVVELETMASRLEKDGLENAQKLKSEMDRVRRRLLTAESLAETDPLTNLGNRRMVERATDGAIAKGVRFCFVLLDLDKFKLVNDRYGHSQGDRLLQAVGKLLSAAVRDGDLVCRWGGDEFVIIMKNVALATAEMRVFQIMGTVFGDFVLDHQSGNVRLKVGASVGIAEHQTGESAEDLFNRADQLLYEQKDRRSMMDPPGVPVLVGKQNAR